MSEKLLLKNYVEPNYFQDEVDIHFSLYDDHCIVSCKTTLRQRRDGQSSLILNGEDLELIKIELDGKELLENQDFDKNSETLTLKNLGKEHSLLVVTKIYPAKNKSLMGLYKSSDFYCTQNEAEGFRKITYFLDRPDNLASFICHIETDKKYSTLLANGDKVGQKDLGGRHIISWKDPFKKPSYLFALVIGNLFCLEDNYTTSSNKQVSLQIFAEEKYKDRLAYAMQSLKDSMQWDEKRFGLEYDLNTYMIVVSDDFNAGAMENKGLNIFNSKYVLCSPETATELDYYQVQSVIGHEYFHNYSGNRVTCRDWFQLSLKEGLTVFRDQEFTSDLNSRAVKRIEDVKNLKASQFTEDSGPNSHPVRPEVVQSIDNFYSATIYEKGAELIRMMHTIMGEEDFQKACKLYFTKYDGMAVTCDDFVDCMQEFCSTDLSQFRRWYSQSGTPLVKINESYQDGKFSVQFQQIHKATNDQKEKKNLTIPIRLKFFNQNSEAVEAKHEKLKANSTDDYLFLLEEENEVIELENIEKITGSYFRDFSSPVNIESNQSKDDLKLLANSDDNLFNRYGLIENFKKEAFFEFYEGKGNAGETYIEIAKQILKEYKKDPSFCFLALSPLHKAGLLIERSTWDFDKFYMASENMDKSISSALSEQFKLVYNELNSETENKVGLEYKGKKDLKNLCLNLLSHTDKELALELAEKQFHNNTDLSHRLGAMNAEKNCKSKIEDMNLLKAFENSWRKDRLVITNFIQKVFSHPKLNKKESLERIESKDYFEAQNPNHLYSSYALFAQSDLIFHKNYQWSYEYLMERIQKIDTFNPQVAGRILGRMQNWNRFDSERKDTMKNLLLKIKQEKTSKNLEEIIDNNLKLL
ncbi:MAG: aminopeptidase N [Bdellovibrionota bacterium]|nr:aminopeptidase N [Bdellovibrionota bacterium]